MKKIAVGSKNPVKIRAVRNVVKKIWPEAKVVAVAVVSNVSQQPTSDNETIQGAKNRASSALQKAKAELGIGIESGTIENQYGMFVTNWAVVVDKNNKVGVGSGGRFLLPKNVAEKIKKGEELGQVIEELTGVKNIKQKQGLIGILTNNLVTRSEVSEMPIIYALTNFINSKYYQ